MDESTDYRNTDAGPQVNECEHSNYADASAAHVAINTTDLPPAIEDMVGLEGRFHQHIEFIPHTHIVSPWCSPDCPDCRDEFGVHDRRHAEIIAETHRE